MHPTVVTHFSWQVRNMRRVKLTRDAAGMVAAVRLLRSYRPELPLKEAVHIVKTL